MGWGEESRKRDGVLMGCGEDDSGLGDDFE